MDRIPRSSREPVDPRFDFDVVAREFAPKVYRLGLSMCGHHVGADDLVQETLLRAWKQRGAFRGESAIGTWLYTIAVRACRRLKRRRAGQPEKIESLDAESAFSAAKIADPRSALDGPDAEDLRRAATRAVDRALPSVPDPYRLPLVLKDIAQLSVAEIARILGLRAATVRTRVHRGRLHLRAAIERVAPRRALPSPAYSLETCLDLLAAKQEAMDRGEPMPDLDRIACERCRAVFSTLDLGQDACRRISTLELPARARRALDSRLRSLGRTTKET